MAICSWSLKACSLSSAIRRHLYYPKRSTGRARLPPTGRVPHRSLALWKAAARVRTAVHRPWGAPLAGTVASLGVGWRAEPYVA
jgi:hypothetical protein